MLTQIGRFQILRQIGQGAMGAVWLGKDPLMGREVAIKCIHAGASMGQEARERFAREARSAGALNHPNVVTVHEFGEDQGMLYLVMEYVKGEDLEQLIRDKSLTKPEFFEVLAQVCDALGEAHAAGIVHRDIKPANVRVFQEGGRLKAKVMDFGVAAMANSDATSDGAWLGTLSYMAPEYLDSGKAGPRSDLFAVGVILFEALTGGRKPFPGDNPSMVLNRLLLHPAEKLEPGDLAGVGPGVAGLVQRALAKRAEDRFATAEALAEQLRAAKDPVWAGPRVQVVEAPRAPDPALVDVEEEADTGHLWSDEEVDPDQVVLIVSRSGQGHCMSLAVAVRRAVPGSRIFVMPGVYRESLVLDKPVEIIGNGKPSDIVVESLNGPCITVRTDRALVANLTLRAQRNGPQDPAFTAVDIAQGQVVLEDCDISSEAAAGVVIHGAGTQPQLHRCRISACGGDGVLVTAQGGGTLDRCIIGEVQGAGIRVDQGGRPTVLRGRIHGAVAAGVQVDKDGEGQFEGCNIYRNGRAGVAVSGFTRARFLQCQIHDGEEFGILATDQGQALFEGCDLFGNQASNVMIQRGANPRVEDTKIHNGREYGVLVTERGTGTFEGCEIFGNRLSALVVSQGGNPVLRHCELHGGMGLGVQVTDEGLGLLEQCEIRDHVMAGAKISRGGAPVFRKCQFVQGRDLGLHFAEGAKGSLEDCVVQGNARGGVRIAKDAEPVIKGGRILDPVQRDGALGLFGL